MPNKNGIGVRFHVLGGVNGECAQEIKKTLTDIAKAVPLKISIDKPDFSKQLDALKRELDQKLGNVKIKINTADATTNGTSSAKTEQITYENLRAQLDKIYQAKLKISSLPNDSIKYVQTNAQLGEQNRKYIEKLKLAAQNRDISAAEFQQLSLYRQELERVLAVEKERNTLATPTAQAKIANKAQSLYTDNGFDKILERSADARKLVDDFNAKVHSVLNQKGGATAQQIKDLNTEFLNVQTRLKQIGVETDTVGNKIKEAFKSKLIQTLAYALIGIMVRALRQVYQNVLDLDKAITDLQIATGKTREETARLVKQYAQLARELGATVTEVTSAADTWLRQGYAIAEVNTLITNTLMLSKLGQLESAEAAKALTSAMKGYKLEVEDCENIVDKFTAVDMKAAVSAGDIATAMAETAASADIAGVSMDKLIGYIATVSEVTQDGAESVGTFYKTLFARMGNVKAGKFVDDETGESLNDVEKVLDSVGISLRDSSGEFRKFSIVLDEVAGEWDRYTSVQQHAIATAFAGTRQQEKFIVLMENYGDALKYAATSASSMGTAQQKYQEAYLDSIEAKLDELTASWQEFSTLILDSELVKGGVEFLTSIVELLNLIAELGDGMLITIPAITVALVAMYAVLQKIKSTTVFITMWTYLKGILAVFPAILLGLKSIIANIYAEAVAHNISRKALMAKTAATKAATAAQQAMNATNPVGWIILAVSAIMALGQALGKYANKTKAAREASEEYKEAAEEAREAAEQSKEQTKELIDLVSEYNDLVKDIDDSASFSADTRQKVLEIQEKITELVGKEADNYDLLNGKVEQNIKDNMALLASEASGAYQEAIDAYYAAMDSSNHAYETSYKDVGGFNFWGLWGLTDPESYYQVVFQAGEDAEKYAAGVYDIIAGMDKRILIAEDATIGDKFYGVNLDVDSAQEAVEVLDELLSKMRAAGYRDGNIYKQFNELRERYNSYVVAQNDAFSEVASSATMSYGMQNYTEGLLIDSLEGYKNYREKLINAIKNDAEITKLGVDSKVIETEVDNWLSLFFDTWYDKFITATQGAIITKKAFIDILKEIEGEFDTLSKALKEITDSGVLSADTLEKLLEEYEGLAKYFKLTNQGYQLAEPYKNWSTSEILNDYVTSYLQPYVNTLAECEEGTENYTIAQNNLNNAIAVCATLLRSVAIDEATESYEAQIDILEEQADAYKNLVDIRKDLLESYKDELDYQDELAEKQKNIASLRTQLSLSRLDTSAAGRARTRQLEQELKEAQEEMDDFTLEHAIEVLTKELDSGYAQYKSFITSEVDRLKQSIEDIAKNIVVNVDVPSASVVEEDTAESSKSTAVAPQRWTSYQDAADAGFGNIAGASASERGRVTGWTNPYTGEKYKNYQEYLDAMYEKYMGKAPVYHEGGFVGGSTSLKSNEEFAKLMNEEYVSTPSQITRFIRETMPRIAQAITQGEVNYNAPLINIKCDSVSKDSIVPLEQIVNKAVKELKKQIDSAFSRTGYKKEVK